MQIGAHESPGAKSLCPSTAVGTGDSSELSLSLSEVCLTRFSISQISMLLLALDNQSKISPNLSISGVYRAASVTFF